MRALNEWEIARRSGFTDISYAAYAEHPTRVKVASALMALQRSGLVSLWDRGVQYDTFVPTAAGARSVNGETDPVSPQLGEPAPAEAPRRAGRMAAAPSRAGRIAAAPSRPSVDPILERLDEILAVLRSIDAQLKGS